MQYKMSFERDDRMLTLLGSQMSECGVICSDFHFDVCPSLVTCFSYFGQLHGFVVSILK